MATIKPRWSCLILTGVGRFHGGGRGRSFKSTAGCGERGRVLFPRSDLNKALFEYNAGTEATWNMATFGFR